MKITYKLNPTELERAVLDYIENNVDSEVQSTEGDVITMSVVYDSELKVYAAVVERTTEVES